MKTCTHEHPCALARIVRTLAPERDENRFEQNQRQWNGILAGAETSGDALGYDGDLICL